MHQDIEAKNKRVAVIVTVIVLTMVGLSFASVPLYDLFCRVTGFGGTPQTSDTLPQEISDRLIRINFITSTARDMPWHFNAERRSITLNIGKNALVNFKAYNPTDKPVVGTAIYNVTPQKAGKYFHKTQCFCFDRQVLTPEQHMNMPVVFYIDPEIENDPNMKDVTVITLSYTFFNSDSQALEKALEAL